MSTYEYLLNKYGITMTFKDAEKELKIYWERIRNMCLRGEIKAPKQKRKWILTTKAVADYIDSAGQSPEREEIIQMPKTGRGFKKIV